jgi:phosphate:Na+ symporter
MQTLSAGQIDWLYVALGVAGGLALFLYGMQMMVKSLVSVAGNQMRYFLSKLTTNRFTAALSGAVVTAIIQSSSITTVLVVGFVSAGLMNLTQAAGVIMGANLGTTITAQIVAFKLDNLALAMIAGGVLVQFLSQTKRKQDFGALVLGLGLIFYGMHVMSEALHPLRQYEPFLAMMREISHPLYGILIGLVFTAVVQSSSATLGIVIVLASNGFLTLPAGIALVLGANIGTTVTALLASIGGNRDAVRAALIHFEFNVLGVLIWLPFIPELAEMARAMALDSSVGQTTVQALAEHTPREIANAHTLFNFINLVLFLPLIPLFVWSVQKLLPPTDEERNREPIQPQYLDEALLTTPTLALDAVRREIGYFKGRMLLLLKRLTAILNDHNFAKLAEQDLYFKQLDSYQTEIMRYLGKISQSDLSEQEQQQFLQLVNTLSLIDAMLESVESDFLQPLHKMMELDIRPSASMTQWMTDLANAIEKAIDKALSAVSQQDQAAAMEVIAMKPTIDGLIQEVLKHQAKNLKANDERISIFRIEMQIINHFKRLHTLSKRIARLVLPENPI